MGMIPGMSQLMTDGMEKQGVERLKRFMTVMDSMTEGELDNPKATAVRTPLRTAGFLYPSPACHEIEHLH